MSKDKKLSKCCKAEIDYRGGGYEGAYIHPVESYCTKCGMTQDINGKEYYPLSNPL